ncbi:U32 family peptidase [Caldicellulosiruptoraceae bacterium PP1]
MKKIELLSPAGGMDELIAAVKAGADTVYIGLSNFSARANAKNFTKENLIEAINFCHLRKRKIYLAFNTLIFNDEIEKAIDLVNYAYNQGIDGIIVQDLGISKILLNNVPNINLHASTQMTVHNSEGVNLLKELGFKRVVLARELSLNEIRNIKKETDIELEIFIHGALCFCYSGQCLFSSIVGQRSGNRGKCAQPCRMRYQILDNNLNKIDDGFLLSTRDISLLNSLPELIKSGVDSLKIEGRMKDKYYVYTVTSIYRKYIDMYYNFGEINISNEDRNKLMIVFNRGNFSNGYLYNKKIENLLYKEAPNNTGLYIGDYEILDNKLIFNTNKNLNNGDIIALRNNQNEIVIEINNNLKGLNNSKYHCVINKGRFALLNQKFKKGKIFLVKSSNLIKQIEENLEKQDISISVDFDIFIKLNEKVRLIAKFDDVTIEVIGQVVQKSEKAELTKQKVAESLKKLGDTNIKVRNINIQLQDKSFLKVSELNQLRREAINKIYQSIISKYKKDIKISLPETNKQIIKREPTKWSILVNNENELRTVLNKTKGIENIDYYIPYSIIENQQPNNLNIIAYFDRITKDKEILEKIHKKLTECNVNQVLVRNLGQLKFFFDLGYSIYVDYSLNITNNYAVQLLSKYNVKRICIPFEVSKNRLNHFNGNLEVEYIVFSRIPLMETEIELYKLGKFLKDRKDNLFEIVKTQYNRTEILNCKTLLINEKDINTNVKRLDFSFTNKEQIEIMIDYFINDLGSLDDLSQYTKGHYERGEYL